MISDGVGNATVSQWENEKEIHSDPADRFIRLFYAIRMELNRGGGGID